MDGTAASLADATALRRSGWRAAIQTTALIAAVLAVVGLLLYGLDSRAQRQATDRYLAQTVASADDTGDPPPGVALALRGADGRVTASAGAPAALAALLVGPPGFTDLSVDGVPYRAFVGEGPQGRVAAMVDLRPREEAADRLLVSVLIASLAGLAGAAVVVTLLSRRSIQPLGRALSLQRRFVADASHELRAPLTVLHTRAQLLADKAGRADLDRQWLDQIDGIVRDTRALGDVVEDLLLTAELQATPDAMRPVDLADTAERVRDAFASHAGLTGVALSVRADPSTLVIVNGSAPALRRAVSALVDNAIAHERRGGAVVIDVEMVGAEARLAVVDTGVGLDPDTAEQLFTRFARGQTQPTGGRRYGIGLALVREVATAHGGRVEVAGAPGTGATFTLVLPALSAAT